MKLLVVEDEHKTADHVRQGLMEAGFVVALARDGPDGLHMATTEHHDLIVLDVMLPGMDGRKILQTIRAAGNQVPVGVAPASDRRGGPRGEVDDGRSSRDGCRRRGFLAPVARGARVLLQDVRAVAAGHVHDAEDVLSKGALNAVEYMRHNPRAVQRFRPWMLRVLHNLCVDVQRAHTRGAELHQHAPAEPKASRG